MHPNLGLPRHAGQWDAQQTSDGDDADDADVVGAVDHDSSVLLQEKFQEDFKRMKEAYWSWSTGNNIEKTHSHAWVLWLSQQTPLCAWPRPQRWQRQRSDRWILPALDPDSDWSGSRSHLTTRAVGVKISGIKDLEIYTRRYFDPLWTVPKGSDWLDEWCVAE